MPLKSIFVSLAFILGSASSGLTALERCCLGYELPPIEEGVKPLTDEEFFERITENFSNTMVFIRMGDQRLCTTNPKVDGSQWFKVSIGRIFLWVEGGNDEYKNNRLLAGILPLKDITPEQCALMSQSAKTLCEDIASFNKKYDFTVYHPSAYPAHRRYPNGKQILMVQTEDRTIKVSVSSTEFHNVNMKTHSYYQSGELEEVIFSDPEIPRLLMEAAPIILNRNIEYLNRTYNLTIFHPTDYADELRFKEGKQVLIVKIGKQMFEVWVRSTRISDMENSHRQYYKSGDLHRTIVSHPEIPAILMEGAISALDQDIANLNQKYDTTIFHPLDYADDLRFKEGKQLLMVKIKEQMFEVWVASTRVSDVANSYGYHYKSGVLEYVLLSHPKIPMILAPNILDADIVSLNKKYGISVFHPTDYADDLRYQNDQQLLMVKVDEQVFFEIRVASTRVSDTQKDYQKYYKSGDLEKALLSYWQRAQRLAPGILEADIANLNQEYNMTIFHPTDYADDVRYRDGQQLLMVNIDEQMFEVWVTSTRVSDMEKSASRRYYESGELWRKISSEFKDKISLKLKEPAQ